MNLKVRSMRLWNLSENIKETETIIGDHITIKRHIEIAADYDCLAADAVQPFVHRAHSRSLLIGFVDGRGTERGVSATADTPRPNNRSDY